jgi:hypothetical protein
MALASELCVAAIYFLSVFGCSIKYNGANKVALDIMKEVFITPESLTFMLTLDSKVLINMKKSIEKR